ncbi:hypothetical protein PAPYR_4793 [Paratrimastix pyriformis]|uniref:F-box domain-containing protein n=1 Tax=Paratrimastix pyriformis TaxID=342808 RepID=A0ABQ8ULW7_9EUKA|nr:hypothetical protein PAPYR_4793 [Paratrimastix pyriformis]
MSSPQLPSELWNQIFGFLSDPSDFYRIIGTCRSFLNEAGHHWQTLRFSPFRGYRCSTFTKFLSNYFSNLRGIELPDDCGDRYSDFLFITDLFSRTDQTTMRLCPAPGQDGAPAPEADNWSDDDDDDDEDDASDFFRKVPTPARPKDGSPRFITLERLAFTKGILHRNIGNLHHLRELSAVSCVLTKDAILAVAQGCPELAVLHLSDCKGDMDEHLEVLATHCRRLVDLNISRTRVTSTGLDHLVQQQCALRTLDLSECAHLQHPLETITGVISAPAAPPPDAAAPPAVVTAAAVPARPTPLSTALVRLNLSRCIQLRDLGDSIRGCLSRATFPRLQELELGEGVTLTGDIHRILFESRATGLTGNTWRLCGVADEGETGCCEVELPAGLDDPCVVREESGQCAASLDSALGPRPWTLLGLDSVLHGPAASPSAFLLSACYSSRGNLHTLSLARTPLSDGLLGAMGRLSPRLENLGLARASGWTGEGLVRMFREMEKEMLNLERCRYSPVLLASLSHAPCRHTLTSLNLAFNRALSDGALQAFCPDPAAAPGTTGLTRLEQLRVSGCDVTDAGVAALYGARIRGDGSIDVVDTPLRYTLRFLDFYANNRLTNTTLVMLSRACRAPMLAATFVGCDQVTNEGARALLMESGLRVTVLALAGTHCTPEVKTMRKTALVYL